MPAKLQSWAFSLTIVAMGVGALVVYGSYFAEIKTAFKAPAPPADKQAAHEYRMALQYANGNGAQDRQKAIELVKLSAEHGFGEAQLLLANAYYRGEVGQDYRQAYIWFSLAIDNGVTKAAPSRYEVAAYLSPAELLLARQEVKQRRQNHSLHQ